MRTERVRDGNAVEVRDLVEEYPTPDGGTLAALNDISFEVRRGEVFGFLGPNGAGKTTTLEILEGLTQPTSGRARVLGMDSVTQRDQMQQLIGVQLQASGYFEYLTLEEILDLFGSFYVRSLKPEPLLEQVGLLDKRRSLVKHLSGGQAQRFSIIAAMVNDPEVVFLEEPTTGLDPQARRNLWDLIEHINGGDGKTVVMTTHYMEEAQVLCDRVAIIDHGEIQALDSPGLVAMGLMNASIGGIAVAITRFREQKILRRILATPLDPNRFLAAQVGAARARNRPVGADPGGRRVRVWCHDPRERAVAVRAGAHR